MLYKFIDLVKVVGTFALLVVAAIVLLMLLVSIVDRYHRPWSEHKKDRKTFDSNLLIAGDGSQKKLPVPNKTERRCL